MLAQQDCANWTCPEGHQAKANAESIFCRCLGDGVGSQQQGVVGVHCVTIIDTL